VPPERGRSPLQNEDDLDVSHRYFYHSFPRRAHHDADRAKRILASICKNGLLLVPEEVSWSDPTQTDKSLRIHAIQRRACFTELSAEELGQHADVFGAFAIEFEIESLRRIGALPVIYVPDALEASTYHDAIGTSLLANLASSAAIIDSIANCKNLTGPTLEVELTMKDGETTLREFSMVETAAIKEYLFLMEKAQGIPYHEMRNALMSMSSIFYPTDHQKYTDQLGYYRQREWRVISGFYIHGVPTTTVATEEQRDELLQIDESFFAKTLKFPDGVFSLAAKSHFLLRVNNRHFLEMARRVVVPKHNVDEIAELLRSHNIGLPVEGSPI